MLRLSRRARPGCATLAGLLAALGCSGPRTGGPPEEAIRHNILGTAYLGQTKWADGEREFRAALALHPGDALLLTNTAIAVNQQGRTEEAVELLRQAVAADPDWPAAHFNLGLIAARNGEFEAAAGHFGEVLRRAPDDLFTLYYLGTALSRTGHEAEALTHLRAALARDPTHVSTLYVTGRLLLQRGEQDEGMQLIARSQEIRARSGLDEAIGSGYAEQGPHSRAADYAGGALAAPPSVPLRFEPALRVELAAADGPAWTLAPHGGGGPIPALWVAQRGTVLQLSPPGRSEPLLPPLAGERIVALAAADADDDGRVDLALLVDDGSGGLAPRLALRDAAGSIGPAQAGSFTGAATARLAEPLDAAELTAVDWDHDGDLDLFWCWAAGAGSGDCRLAANDSSGRFEVRQGQAAGLAARPPAGPLRVAFSDADNDRDVDLLLLDARGLWLYSNQRDGTFADVSASAGLGPAVAGCRSFEIADMDKDGFMDLVAGGADAPLVLFNRAGRFDPARNLGGAPAAAPGARVPLVLDADNDGFLDVLVSTAQGPALYRNRGAGRFEADAQALAAAAPAADARPLAAVDLDADGDLDLALVDGRGALTILHQTAATPQRWIALDSRGVGDNHFGIGAKVEVLAGALRQKFEVTRPLPLHVGLGPRKELQSARYLWPSGVLQDEIALAADQRLSITQLDRKGTSCPLLYAWRGGRWDFVTDFLGGSAIGYQVAPGVFGQPDTDEYVRIGNALDRDEDARLRLRLNNQLEEVIWFDRVQLVAVDHPAGSEVWPDEALMPGPPFPAFRLWAGSDVRPVRSARAVEAALDVTSQLRELDRAYAAGFDRLRPKGYAVPHTLELDLGRLPAERRVVLLLDGWIDYADSSANIAAAQAGLVLSPPRLSLADGRGGWIPGPRMGFPAGLPKTVTVDLTGRLSPADTRLRIETSMRIHWDRARVLVGGEDADVRVARLDAVQAELRFGGFPRESSPDGRPPWGYDAADVDTICPWKVHRGAYTAFGDVTDLLRALDDRFVTTRSGDEIELRFDDPGPEPAGFQRTYLLYADGFGKDMDLNSAASDEVAPVPFHGMPSYPYPADVGPPRSAAAPGGPLRHVTAPPGGWPGAGAPIR
jgi:tetratricopeptide (TPR) repeat protein